MNTGILSLWGIWDTIYQNCSRLQYIEKGKNIFRVVTLHYSGEPLTTSSKQTIESGHLIIKLHIHNYLFANLCRGIKNDTRMILLLRRQITESLPMLAAFLAAHPRADEIKGIVGTTMLYKGVEQLGFSISDVPMTWFFRYKRWYLRLMLRIIHPDGIKRLKTFDKNIPLKRVYMSKEELLNRYLTSQ
ncbi:YkoP family protein [Brevibacillus ginsengisoli]|uniref:YkoP family protein n=1 Tax=Brevibacillus ginsengisoli TaxID=363854 RepID=UPI003CFAFDDF